MLHSTYMILNRTPLCFLCISSTLRMMLMSFDVCKGFVIHCSWNNGHSNLCVQLHPENLSSFPWVSLLKMLIRWLTSVLYIPRLTRSSTVWVATAFVKEKNFAFFFLWPRCPYLYSLGPHTLWVCSFWLHFLQYTSLNLHAEGSWINFHIGHLALWLALTLLFCSGAICVSPFPSLPLLWCSTISIVIPISKACLEVRFSSIKSLFFVQSTHKLVS